VNEKNGDELYKYLLLFHHPPPSSILLIPLLSSSPSSKFFQPPLQMHFSLLSYQLCGWEGECKETMAWMIVEWWCEWKEWGILFFIIVEKEQFVIFYFYFLLPLCCLFFPRYCFFRFCLPIIYFFNLYFPRQLLILFIALFVFRNALVSSSSSIFFWYCVFYICFPDVAAASLLLRISCLLLLLPYSRFWILLLLHNGIAVYFVNKIYV
jgi:hypothetical protein